MSENFQAEAIRQITICGVGLIGGSIALAVRERWPSVRVLGIDRSGVLAHALGSGAIDRGAGDAQRDAGHLAGGGVGATAAMERGLAGRQLAEHLPRLALSDETLDELDELIDGRRSDTARAPEL